MTVSIIALLSVLANTYMASVQPENVFGYLLLNFLVLLYPIFKDQ